MYIKDNVNFFLSETRVKHIDFRCSVDFNIIIIM